MVDVLKKRERGVTGNQVHGESKKRTKLNKLHNELTDETSAARHRQWVRFVVILSVLTIVYFYGEYRNRKDTKFALVRETLSLRIQKFNCSENYASEIAKFPECVPKKCGRFVTDKLVDSKEVEMLLDLSKRILSKAGSSGGASILDIHTGAMSYGEQFLNVYTIPQLVSEFREDHLKVYNFVQNKIKKAIADQFQIPAASLYLTYPTFFSKINNVSAKSIHDEYWHEHVDKETYPSFHYTSLLYLNTHDKDFQGGRFIYVDGIGENRTTSFIEPKMGRVNAFSSGSENRHHVEKVIAGERYAVTISFTCNKELGITDPKIKKVD